jgi:H+-transporting ATPase
LGGDSKVGLTAAEAQALLAKYGRNALEEQKESALSAYLGFFWGPIPWMIEAAALTALFVHTWGDITIIAAL